MAEEPKTPSESASPIAEIEHGPSKFEQFLDRNHKKLIIGASVLVLAISGTYLYTELQKTKEENAGESLVSALNQETPEAAAVELEKVIQENSGARASTTAELFLALAKWRSGDQENAVQLLETFIAEHPENPEVGTAMVKLANFQIELGQTDKAKATLNTIISSPNAQFAAPYALLALGDLAVADGDKEAARGFYNRIRKELPNSPTATASGSGFRGMTQDVIGERLELLDIAPPTPFTPEVKPEKKEGSELPPLPTPPAPADGGATPEDSPAQPAPPVEPAAPAEPAEEDASAPAEQ